ncbi:hypothetical protein LOD99_327 [Oopsacas minuta]|uniref:Glycosyltransferase family 92 protein n=1 Tax=Oopsacas minuta TaxID=111878 RepID=A0AAV7K8Q1_9METZ|nr:hypothetical protein LOD99_327 [Oopsacas minuta]
MSRWCKVSRLKIMTGILSIILFLSITYFSNVFFELINEEPWERHARDMQWIRNTKTRLYEDKAKDGSYSYESLIINFKFANNYLSKRCESWKQQTNKLIENIQQSIADVPKYYLTAVIFVRIYEHDKSNITARDLLQWIRYYLYIGVEHFYIYDNYVVEEECQRDYLYEYIQAGFVSYFDWHDRNPYTMEIQRAAYQEVINKFKHDTVWQMALDVDEYPYSPIDKDPGFLTRFISKFEQLNPGITEITLSNYLVLGEPDIEKDWFIERIFRETKKEANNLVKPIYRPKYVRARLHRNIVLSGYSVKANEDEIRFKHYWSARLQNWGPDTEEVLELTTPEYGIIDISYTLKNCIVETLPNPF